MRNPDSIVEGLINRYRERSAASAAHHQRCLQVSPAGVNSSLRAWKPYPLYFVRADGARLDGNEYLDCAAAQGVLVVGHCNPIVLEAVRKQLERLTVVGASHPSECELCELILERYPCHNQVRLTTTGSEAVAHAVRLARAATGRDRILKAEGTYHGNYDPLMVSFTPELSDAGPPSKPNRIPVTAGLTLGSIHDTVVFPFNNVEALEQRLTEYAGSVAAIIVEPVILNMGCTLPKPGYLREVRELCNRNSVLLIFDEAKTGAKIAYGGAPEYSGVAPDITCLAKAVGGGFPIGAIAASRDLMKLIGSGDVWQTGSFAANSISVAAGIATLRDVLTREVYSRLFALNQRLAEGYRAMLRRHEIEGCVQTAGVTSSVFFTAGPVHNYRDSCKASPNAFMVYWYGMLEHSIIPQTYGRDDAWTLTVAHTQQDVDSIIAAFDEIGFQITCVQSESAAGTVRPG